MFSPTLGMVVMPRFSQRVSVALVPVVTKVWSMGALFTSFFMSVGSTISRNLSEALPAFLMTAVAVS